MTLWKRGGRYWTDFTVDGVRFRKPTRTSDRNAAKVEERRLIEAARHGKLGVRQIGQRTLFKAVEAYIAAKRMRTSPRTVELELERLSLIKKHFGDIRVASITPAKIADYQQIRHDAGIANRTINMDVGVLLRVLKSTGRAIQIDGAVQHLPERPSLIGRALTHNEQRRLFDTAGKNPDWEHVYCAAMLAANTSLRPVEVKHLRRRDVDVFKKILTVRRSKNQSSHRVIPLNASAVRAASRMLERGRQLGHESDEHDLWPACRWGKIDPTKPIAKWDTAWRALRKAAKLPGLRFHDLRHTIITELAEMGVADHVLESISGHLSRRMLEHYSHIRLEAKRDALEALEKARDGARDIDSAKPIAESVSVKPNVNH